MKTPIQEAIEKLARYEPGHESGLMEADQRGDYLRFDDVSEALAPASPASASVDERAAFEVWHSKKFGWLSERDLILNSNYADYRAQERWEIWQARAALAAPLPPVVARKVLTDDQLYTMWSDAWTKGITDAGPVIGNVDAAHNARPINFARAIERHLMGGE